MVDRKALAKRALRVTAIGFGIPLILLVLFAMFFSDSLIYFPSKYPEGDWDLPKRSPFRIEEVSYAATDGTKLVGWYAPAKDAKATILLMHGNAGNITDRYSYFHAFQKIPASAFLVGYRGYGKSEGTPSEKGLYADAQASYDWLVAQGVKPESIVLYGESLGGGVAVELATRVKCAGLIVQCTFSSVADMQRRVIPIPLGWAMSTKMASVDKIGAITIPKLHFHSPPDEVVPYALGKKLFDAGAEPKRWVVYPDLGHNEWPGRYAGMWFGEISKFIGEVVK